MEAVFHVAAKAGYWGSWASFYGPNVTGTQYVIAACRKHGVPKLIHTSTPSVVASQRSRAGEDESLPYPAEFEGFYSHTKAIAEQEVKQANDVHLLTVSLRPHIIFGPRDTQILPRLVSRAKAGRLVQIGDGHNKVDATYVEDAARAHLLAEAALRPGSPACGSAYFISQDSPVKLWPWVNELLSQLGVPPVKRRISLPVARTAGGLLEFIYRTFRLKGEPPLTRFLANELALDHYYNISRAKKELGYRPQASMDEAVRRTIDHFKQASLD
jgi:nucleoside-diphosphate-sugar epimerase